MKMIIFIHIYLSLVLMNLFYLLFLRHWLAVLFKSNLSVRRQEIPLICYWSYFSYGDFIKSKIFHKDIEISIPYFNNKARQYSM